MSSSPFERVPPHDEAAEVAVLGSLLLDYPSAWPAVQAEGLRASDFYRSAHAALFRRLSLWAWADRQPDVVVLVESLAAEVGGPDEARALIVEVLGNTPSAANADFYARQVRAKALRRGLIANAWRNLARAHEDEEKAPFAQELQFAIDELEELRDGISRRELATFNGNQLLADPPEPRNLIVGKGILALGEWILFLGEPKAGKSALALDLAAELVRDLEAESTWAGIPVFGGRRVLYLVGEGGRRSMYARWAKRAQGLGVHERARFLTWFPDPQLMDLTRPEEYSRLERFVLENAVEVLIVDPLAHFHNGEENDAGDIKRVAGQFIRLHTTTGCASIVVHHTRKAQVTSRRGSPLEGRGSSALYGASDGAVMFEFEGDQDDPERRMTFSLRHAEEYVDPQIVTLNRLLLRFELQTTRIGRPQADGLTPDDFMDWIAGHGRPVTLKDAAAETAIPLRTIERWKNDLLESGQLRRFRESTRKPFLYGLPTWFDEADAPTTQRTFADAPPKSDSPNGAASRATDPATSEED